MCYFRWHLHNKCCILSSSVQCGAYRTFPCDSHPFHTFTQTSVSEVSGGLQKDELDKEQAPHKPDRMVWTPEPWEVYIDTYRAL